MSPCPNHPARKAAKRGLCLTCYNTLARRVHRGTDTWDAIEAEGLALPQQPRGRPRKAMKAIAPPT